MIKLRYKDSQLMWISFDYHGYRNSRHEISAKKIMKTMTLTMHSGFRRWQQTKLLLNNIRVVTVFRLHPVLGGTKWLLISIWAGRPLMRTWLAPCPDRQERVRSLTWSSSVRTTRSSPPTRSSSAAPAHSSGASCSSTRRTSRGRDLQSWSLI